MDNFHSATFVELSLYIQIVSIFGLTAKNYDLHPDEGWEVLLNNIHNAGSVPPMKLNNINCQITLQIRVISIFDETIVFYISQSGRTIPFHIPIHNFSDSNNILSINKLKQHLCLTIFDPIFSPNKELPTLTMISKPNILHIFSYLQAKELCQISQTSKILQKSCYDHELWRNLLVFDFKTILYNTTTIYDNNNHSSRLLYWKYKEEYLMKRKKEKLLQIYMSQNPYFLSQRLQSDSYYPIILDPLHLPKFRLPILGTPPSLLPSLLHTGIEDIQNIYSASSTSGSNTGSSNYPYSNGFHIPNSNSSSTYDTWW